MRSLLTNKQIKLIKFVVSHEFSSTRIRHQRHLIGHKESIGLNIFTNSIINSNNLQETCQICLVPTLSTVSNELS